MGNCKPESVWLRGRRLKEHRTQVTKYSSKSSCRDYAERSRLKTRLIASRTVRTFRWKVTLRERSVPNKRNQGRRTKTTSKKI